MQDEPEGMGTLPEPAQHAVEAHAEAAGEGAHLPLHSHADDVAVSQVAERFEPEHARAWQPEQA